MPVTEDFPPPDPTGIPDLPELPGKVAGRKSKQGARTCLLVHLHYLTAVPVSEAPRPAADSGKALPDGHY